MIKPVIENGMDPREAAAVVLKAISEKKFWIFSHPHVPETAMKQAVAMIESETLTDL